MHLMPEHMSAGCQSYGSTVEIKKKLAIHYLRQGAVHEEIQTSWAQKEGPADTNGSSYVNSASYWIP